MELNEENVQKWGYGWRTVVNQEGQRNYKEEVRADVKKIQSGKAVCPHDKPVKVWEMSGREDTVLESEDA